MGLKNLSRIRGSMGEGLIRLKSSAPMKCSKISVLPFEKQEATIFHNNIFETILFIFIAMCCLFGLAKQKKANRRYLLIRNVKEEHERLIEESSCLGLK